MPLYEYACNACEHRFETIQKASEEPLRDCPECGTETLKKLLSAPVFRLKGSGWYETDFKTSDKRNLSSSSSSDDGAPESADRGDKADAGAKAESNGKPDKNGGDSTAASSASASAGKGGKSETSKQTSTPAAAPAKD